MTDAPPPPRPANEPGDEGPSSDTPTEVVGATEAPDATPLNAGGWPPASATRGGRLRRMGGRLRGSRVALAVLAVIVAAGLVLGGFALADGGRDGKGGRDGRGAAGQRDDNRDGRDSGNRDGRNDNVGRGARNGGDSNRRDGNGNGTSGTEQSVLGTITAVSTSSITLRTSGGSPVYPLTATTPVTRNGSAAGVADLKVGDAVVVHVVTTTAGATPVVERISVG